MDRNDRGEGDERIRYGKERWVSMDVYLLEGIFTDECVVSKHSRAARRNEIQEPEAKALETLPRAEKTDLTSVIIRATAKKNEDLLTSKMNKKERSKNKVTKKSTPVTNINKERVERAINLSERLEGKISKSKQRAKMVQTTRKANWDVINSEVKIRTETLEAASDDKDSEKLQEDSMVDDFYEVDKPKIQTAKNAFALLDEVEL